jgi:hypothetical protein
MARRNIRSVGAPRRHEQTRQRPAALHLCLRPPRGRPLRIRSQVFNHLRSGCDVPLPDESRAPSRHGVCSRPCAPGLALHACARFPPAEAGLCPLQCVGRMCLRRHTRPARGLSCVAPVKAPLMWPKSSLSKSVSTTTEQLHTAKRPDAAGLSLCSAAAASSFPVPVAPVMRTVRK